MEDFRVLGNKIMSISNQKGISVEEISEKLGQSVQQINMGLVGRKMFSFPQLEEISGVLSVPVESFFENDSKESPWYIDCMNEFENEKNREEILDIIYDYLDILDSVTS